LNHFGFPLNSFDEEHDQEIDSIVSLINSNEQMIRSLHIRDHRIKDHILNDICGQRDFNELTLNCLLIS
jgi:23S rRNA A1618 N6-methylase RlmF